MKKTIYTHQRESQFKTMLLMTSFLGLVIGLGYVISQIIGDPGILYIFIAISIFMNIGAYWFSDKIVLRMTHAKPAARDDNPQLYNLVQNLAITAGLPMPKLYILEDRVPNAFATGRNKDSAVVAVSTGLLRIMDKAELEGVVAHELAHIGNKDMLVSTMAVILAGFVSIVADWFMRASMFCGNDSRGNNGLAIVVGIVIAILAPLFASLLRLAVSRRREFLADASAALLTRYPEGLESALEKLGKYSGKMQHAHKTTAHLFIATPFGKAAKRMGHIFSTHPPIGERVRRLREMGQ